MPVQIMEDRCIGCGLCVGDCPELCLSIREGVAAFDGQNGACMVCGHCVSICPENAVSIPAFRMDAVEGHTPGDLRMDAGRLQLFMSGRRSVRQYAERPVEREKLAEILETGRMSPTASNLQKVRFVVLERELPEFKRMAVEALYHNREDVMQTTGLSRYEKKFTRFFDELTQGGDSFFFGAPTVIAVIDGSGSPISGAMAASRMELTAAALGLGVCYNGLFVRAATYDPRIGEKLGLSGRDVLVTTLAIGYPNVSYLRTAPRKALDVTWM